MKKILIIIFIIGLYTVASADKLKYDIPICVTVNENYVNFEDKPLLIDSVTYLPARFFL